MGGPKHLWSGDWQQESAAAASDNVAVRRPAPQDDESAVPLPRPARGSRDDEPAVPARRPAPAQRARPIAWRPGLRRGAPIALAVLILAAAGYGVTTLLDSSGSPASASGTGPLATQASTIAAGAPRRVSWLGMEIVTLPPGAAVIETVQLGSPGNAAGLEPGDVILQINNRPIHAATDIAAAISGLRAGDRVQMQISYGSALYQTEATLAGPPSVHP